MQTIKKVEYAGGYKLKLTFKGKEQKLVDLAKYKDKGPETVFYPFKDLEFFKSVKVDNRIGTIVWPNGLDLCPDSLYEMGKTITAEEGGSLKKPTLRASVRRKSKNSKTATT